MGSKGGGVNMPSADEMARAGAHYNRLDQYTPYGSVQYLGPDKTTVVQTLSPEMQALQESMLGLRGTALGKLLGRYGGSPISLSMPSVTPSDYGYATYGGSAPPPEGTGYNYGGDTTTYPPQQAPAPGDPVSDGEGAPAWTPPGRPDLPELSYDLDLASLPGITGRDDMLGYEDKISQAMYDRMSSLLDPTYEREESRLRQMYANRGMPVGAAEFNEELGMFGQRKGEAYEKAALDAVLGGRQYASSLTGDELGIRQGSLSERLAQLGSTNAARGQGFGEWMGERAQSFAEHMGLSQQEFSELASILGIAGAPGAGGDLGQFYGPSPVDVMGAYNTDMQAQMYNNQNPWMDILGGLIGAGGQVGGAYWGSKR